MTASHSFEVQNTTNNIDDDTNIASNDPAQSSDSGNTMRPASLILAVVSCLSASIAAHPFIIVNTHITTVHIQDARPTPQHAKRQNFFDSLTSAVDSALGFGDATSTSTSKKNQQTTSASSVSMKTLAPPAVATTTSSESSDDSSSTSTDDDSDDSSTSTDSSTTTDSSSTTEASTSSTSSSSTIPPTTTATPASTSAAPQSTTTSSANKSANNGSGVPPAGIAVAVVMIILILIVTAFLVFKYHPQSRAWWAAREARLFQQRSYRDALDNPNSSTSNLRQEALGTGASRRATMLKSFFAPATAKLGYGQEIKRKPVNWGASTPSLSSPTGKSIEEDTEKIPMTASAAPMGQIERYSMFAGSKKRDTPRSPTEVIVELPTPTDERESIKPPTKQPSQAQAKRVSAAKELDTNTAPVGPISPVSLRPKPSLSSMPPVSPISMHARGRSHTSTTVADPGRELPALPPVPSLPPLIHAKRGSDGVFRLT